MLPKLKLPAQVSIVHASAVPPLLVKGRCVTQAGDELSIEVPPGTELPASVQLIVDFAGEPGVSRAIVTVLGHRDGRLLVQILRVPTSDQREYPRMHGGITLRYHLLPRATAAEAAEVWMRGGPPAGREYDPDPFMNFSVTGLAFDDVVTCQEHDLLGILVKVPGVDHTWRGVASVVRVSKIPIDERDDTIAATHRISVNFHELPDEARVALGKHTERIQEAWL
ncbi:MAG: hypothetical protein EXR71_14070 [Myxococcales bacterium]|nr:hypothetical protein [Myxococcales bacterium]